MEIPANYEKLGRAGYVNRQNYSATATYNRMDTVYYQGSTYVALADNLTGVSPDDSGSSWMYLARGFSNVDEINSDIASLKSKITLLESSASENPAINNTLIITAPNGISYPTLLIFGQRGDTILSIVTGRGLFSDNPRCVYSDLGNEKATEFSASYGKMKIKFAGAYVNITAISSTNFTYEWTFEE